MIGYWHDAVVYHLSVRLSVCDTVTVQLWLKDTRRFVTFYISALEILLLTYLLTYPTASV